MCLWKASCRDAVLTGATSIAASPISVIISVPADSDLVTSTINAAKAIAERTRAEKRDNNLNISLPGEERATGARMGDENHTSPYFIPL